MCIRDSSWAEPYVAACYTHGIISGYDAKTFGGSDSVTAAQAALMMMKALGYFQYQSDFLSLIHISLQYGPLQVRAASSIS